MEGGSHLNKFIMFCFACLLLVLFFSLPILIVRCGDGEIWQEWWLIDFSGEDLGDGYGNTMDIRGWAIVRLDSTGQRIIRSYGALAVTIDGNTEVLGWKATAVDIHIGTGWAEASLILKILAALPEYAEVDMIGIEGKPYLGPIEVGFRNRLFAGSGMVQIENDTAFAFYNHFRSYQNQLLL